MKKIFTIAIALAVPLAMLAQSKQTPYSSAIGNDADWTTVNVQEGSKTWELLEKNPYSYYDPLSGTGYEYGMQYEADSANPADDWLISPAITLEAGKKYSVKFWAERQSSYYNEKFRLVMSDDNSVDTFKSAGTVLYEYDNSDSEMKKRVSTVVPEVSGDYYFAIQVYSDKRYSGGVNVTGFEVTEYKLVPSPVTGLKIEPDANRALSARISWALPTADVDGVAFGDDVAIDFVRVYRDDVEIAQLDGTATEFTDTADKGLTAGKHTYAVEVEIHKVVSERVSLESKHIGPVPAVAIPWTSDFKNVNLSDFELYYKIVKGSKSTVITGWNYSSNTVKYSPTNSRVEDDWLLLPAMNFTAAGPYRLRVKAKNPGKTANFEVLVGRGDDIAAYTKIIGTMTEIPSAATDFYFEFDVPEAGSDYRLALHACRPEATSQIFEFPEFEVMAWHIAPAQVADLKAVEKENGVELSWTNPALSSSGVQLGKIDKIEILRDNVVIKTIADNPVPGAPMAYIDACDKNGVVEYSVLCYTGEYPADGALIPATLWVGDRTQVLPYSYDFKNPAINAIWSSESNDGDLVGWEISDGLVKFAPSTLSEARDEDDYLITPPFSLEQGFYKVTLMVKGGSKDLPLKVATMKENDKNLTLINPQSLALSASTYGQSLNVILKVAEAGRYCFAMNAAGNYTSDVKDIEITKIDIASAPLLPDVAGEVTVTPNADNENKAVISWRNPATSNVQGEAPVLAKAEIYRDDNVVGTVTEGLVPGEMSTFEDTDVESGFHKYKVVVSGPEGASSTKPTEVKSGWIGAGLSVPYTPDGFGDFVILNEDGTERSGWYSYVWEPTSWNKTIGIENPDGVEVDDWAISHKVNLEEGKFYDFSITGYTDYYTAEDFELEIYCGTGYTVAELPHKVISHNSFAKSSSSAQPLTFTIKAVSPSQPSVADFADNAESAIAVPAGHNAFAFRVKQAGSLTLKDLKITENSDIDTGVKNILTSDAIVLTNNVVYLPESAESVRIFNVAGTQVYSQDGAHPVAIESWNSGVYIVVVSTPSGTTSKTICK